MGLIRVPEENLGFDATLDDALGRMQHLYILRHPWQPWTKIGIARNVSERMSTYRHAWGCEPFPPVVVQNLVLLMFGVHDAREMEQWILRRFSALRVSGEWLERRAAVYEVEKLASILHPEHPVDYLDALIPFGEAIGWPTERYRFRTNGRGARYLASGGTLRGQSRPSLRSPALLYRGESPKV